MKTVTGIVFLLLLLYNMLGPSVAVLCFESDFQIADAISEKSEIRILKASDPSVSRSGISENAYASEGLYRMDDQLYNVVRQIRENDTLYVTLQSNESAWQRFSELSELIQEVNSETKATHPVSSVFKVLKDLLKVYLPVNGAAHESENQFKERFERTLYAELQHVLISETSPLPSPPPEFI